MLKQSLIAPAFVAFALAAATVASMPAQAAGADPTIPEVYKAADAGRFDDAQKMMDQVLKDHPNSAKAHFVEAELLSKEARYSDAQTELSTALRLDSTQSFAKPGRVQELQNIINGTHQTRVVQHTAPPAPVYVSRPQPQSSGNGIGLIAIIIIFVAIFAVIAMVRSAMRRNVVVTGGYGPGGGYAPGGYAPGYGPGYGGGGMGSGILGGLATGAAVGAGIVAGEELMEHMTGRDRERTEYVRDDGVRNDTSWDDNSRSNNDMGGNDFGVSDSSSWDSGGDSGGGSDDW